jgi:hypothetical protein
MKRVSAPQCIYRFAIQKQHYCRTDVLRTAHQTVKYNLISSFNRFFRNMELNEMKVFSLLIAAASAVSLAACSMTLPVHGQLQQSDEAFNGTATGYMDGGGDLKVVTTYGAVCKGNFVYVTRRNGEGVFHCDDGRSGPFEFVSTGTRGTGSGDLGGERFTFTFGG